MKTPQRLSAVLVLTMKAGRCLGVAFWLSVVELQAGATETEPAKNKSHIQAKDSLERVWEAFRLYDNKKNPVIQEFSLVGRYHGQYSSVRADQGKTNEWENRRIFIGAEAVLFHDFTVHAQIRISEDFNPFYDGLYQAYVKWSPDESFSLSAGRLDFLFAGLERSVSSTKIVTFERGLLVNQLLPGEVVGTLVQGKAGDFSYRAGVFSGSIENEFTSFTGGFGAVAGVGYNAPLFYETGSIHLDYLYNNGNASNTALEPYDHVLSLWHQGQIGPFSLEVEMTWAHGIAEHKTVWGATALGTYELFKDLLRKGDALQAVIRYQYAASDGNNGLQLQSRYEQKVVPGGSGNAYNAVYAGINYLIYSNRLKLMTGVEYAAMEDSASGHNSFNGWTFFAGVRLYF
jgi:phosphate-selective porin OprO/OprP